MFIGHKREDGMLQPLCEHLTNTAHIAAMFANSFDAYNHAYRTGLLHDIGKYSPAGQRRMRDPENTRKIDHASAGTQTAANMSDLPSAFAISGHHGGLRNLGSRADSVSDGTLYARLKVKLDGELNYSSYSDELNPTPGNMLPQWLNVKNPYQVQFYIRMLFSCLVDADYLDTAAFMQSAARETGPYASIETLAEKLMQHIQPWLNVHDNTLNGIRSDILRSSLKAAHGRPGFYSMTVPTGGGKTVSSMAFALQHARAYSKKRIIYVIPYTSIIEQNARIFSGILGHTNILEHHSGISANDVESDLSTMHQLSAENWDAPIIVTTAVQFFESLYSSKTSKCRKLHNIAESVIIFDEAQMIPLNYLKPCVSAIAELVKNYQCTAVLCTATQPSLSGFIHEYDEHLQVKEICPESAWNSEVFRRVTYKWHAELDEESVVHNLSLQPQVLCIVNTRKKAKSLWEMLPADGRYHLSTLMTAEHRSSVLKEIRERLCSGLTCRVVSTSLIEAGVDIDFPEVWREEAGLDSILQAGGRCNREGKRSADECFVHIFSLPGKTLKMLEQHVHAMRSSSSGSDYPASHEIITGYFSSLYRLRGASLDLKSIIANCQKLKFRDVSDSFNLIEDNTTTIYIPSNENAASIRDLTEGHVSRQLLRDLGTSCVNVYDHQLKQLLSTGKISEHGGFYILSDPTAYSDEYGLDIESETGIGIMI